MILSNKEFLIPWKLLLFKSSHLKFFSMCIFLYSLTLYNYHNYNRYGGRWSSPFTNTWLMKWNYLMFVVEKHESYQEFLMNVKIWEGDPIDVHAHLTKS